jgi:methenyltetrahydromethanopterin cyclohydrolase
MPIGTSRNVSRSNACSAHSYEKECQQVKCLYCKYAGGALSVGQMLVMEMGRSRTVIISDDRTYSEILVTNTSLLVSSM